MLYTVAIPAKFAAEFATGSVALMNTSAGLTTSLVNSSTGTVVGWAALVPVSGTAAGAGLRSAGAAAGSSGGAIAATASGVALGPILVIGLGGVAIVGLGGALWRRSRKSAAADAEEMVELIVECDEADAAAVLAEVHGIVEAAATRMIA
jgi:hypothetical protein